MSKTFTLSNGKIAKVRNGIGYDLLQAQQKAKTSEEIPYALIAELTEIDGQKLVYEDILELPLEDVITLQTAISGKLESKPVSQVKPKEVTNPIVSPTVNQ